MNPVSLMLSLLKKHDLCAYIINLSDPHLSEFIAESDKHLEKLTGFTGSNGLAIVSEKEKVLYTDGRYFIQAKNELTDFKLKKYSVDEKVNEYLLNNFNDCVIGIDKSRISFSEFSDLQDKLKIKNVNLKHFCVDEFVKGMPERKFHSVIDLEKKHISDFYICDEEDSEIKSVKPQESFLNKEISHCDRKLEKSRKPERIFSDNSEINSLLVKANNLSGSFRKEKLKKVMDSLEEDALLITELDTIAWLLNLRGKDIPYNPVFFSYLLLTKEKPILFTNTKINLPNLEIKKYSEIQEELKRFKKIMVSGECNALLVESMTDYKFSDEINLAKSKKNEVEIEGMKLAHILDGISLCLLFGWLEKNIGSVTEKEVSDKLVEIKKRFKAFYSESFETICGGGKNAAIIHHKAGNDILHKDEMILLDSGTQYFFGTTDVTRTLHFGTPSLEEKVNYTRVLKGFLLAKSTNLPKKQKLSALDILSRIFLWKDFLDFNHSTSHGVGHFLNVHEQPPSYNDTLSPNQVISIEPGYYKENEYGIRIEDLVYVEEKNDFYKFNSLTVVPFHLKLIELSLLSDEERGLINEYNQFVRSKLQSILEGTEGYDYLMINTEKI